MKYKLISNNLRYILIAAAFLFVVVMSLSIGYHFFVNSAGEGSVSYSLSVNDYGHTYMNSGTFCYSIPAEDWPDVLKVVATNGEMGYVITTEIAEAEGAFLTSAEVWDRQTRRPTIIANAFAELLESELGVPILELSDNCRLELVITAKAMEGLIFDFMFSGGASSGEYSECGEEVAHFIEYAEIEMVSKLRSLGTVESEIAELLENVLICEDSMAVLRESISRLYFEAEQAAITFVPVYGSNVETVIGEFPILLPPIQ